MLTAQKIYLAITSDYGSMEDAEAMVATYLKDYRDSILNEAIKRVSELKEGYYDTYHAARWDAITALSNYRDNS